jgi:hypothetical protein
LPQTSSINPHNYNCRSQRSISPSNPAFIILSSLCFTYRSSTGNRYLHTKNNNQHLLFFGLNPPMNGQKRG